MLKKIETEEQLVELAKMANKIWHEYFPCIITKPQIDYMIEKFQSYEAISKQLKKGYEYYFLIAEGKNVGYTGIKEENGKLFLSKLYIEKPHRGKGYASKALAELVSICNERNLTAIWLTVNKNNHTTISIYEKKDFEAIGEELSDIGNGFVMDDYVMEKKVKPE